MSTPSGPLVALISAVPAAIPPATAMFQRDFPDARLWNLLDDRLLQDAARDGGVTPKLGARMGRLIDHAMTGGAHAVLVTCSMYAPIAHRFAGHTEIPVLGPDDAVFAEAASGRFSRMLVISNAADPLADSVHRFTALAGDGVTVTGAVATGAAEAARRGNVGGLAHSIATAAGEAGGKFDAILLGQYSLAPAASAVQAQTGLPTLAGPQFAVAAIRRRLKGGF